ncbi:hypothetical protein BRADI_4g15113v3 [Brachypodium distachyon]|uniref:Uncharacterized protein n=1 Tax=Brachypodium distachyon TaxID=15368 RepID=A0A2K2CMZ7_BRADI|nr:hypothetical protein BRADI_4g15113v3 [Brachypodium distachyon]
MTVRLAYVASARRAFGSVRGGGLGARGASLALCRSAAARGCYPVLDARLAVACCLLRRFPGDLAGVGRASGVFFSGSLSLGPTLPSSLHLLQSLIEGQADEIAVDDTCSLLFRTTTHLKSRN